MPRKDSTIGTRYDAEIGNVDVKLADILDTIDAKINLAEYEGLYALQSLREAIVSKYASIPKALEFLSKRAHEAVDEVALRDEADAQHKEVEDCAAVLREAIVRSKQ